MPTPARHPNSALERFLRYVRVDTRADEAATTFPSTPGQLDLLRMLAEECRAIGLQDVEMDEWGYVFATIPATTTRPGVPTLGLVAHVDTSPEMSGTDVRPIVHRSWDGSDITLPDDPSAVLRPSEIPYLRAHIGEDIVTASGRTLLGADDKAGVAEIMAAAEYLMQHPEIEHGRIRIAFTPDEEIGRGADHFDVARFGADFAFTLDGSELGELESESFSADAMAITFHGFNTHPGWATGRMVNAIRVAADFLASLPRDGWAPETTAGYDGFVHPIAMDASVDRTTVRFIVRSFRTPELATFEARLTALAEAAAARWPGASVTTEVREQYRNMREVLDHHPAVLAFAREALRRSGIEPIEKPIRGGTDGSRLSFMGLPTPNLFAGEQNVHSRLEWISVRDMDRAVDVILALAQVVAEEATA